MQKRLIKLKSIFILNSQKRKLYRKNKYNNLKNKKNRKFIGSNTWGVSYSVFDNFELLEPSLLSIRDDIDYINVVYQKTSWYGEPCHPELTSILKDLQNRGLIDELIEFTPSKDLTASQNETAKRNIGLDIAKKKNVQFFMTMDCDEFYKSDEIKTAKEYIIKNKITHSYCPIYAYGNDPTQLCIEAKLNVDDNADHHDFLKQKIGFVPFFTNLKYANKIIYILNINNLPCNVDPTRALDNKGNMISKVLDIVIMHHMSHVRMDLNKKYRNTSYYNRTRPYPKFQFNEKNTKKVEDFFAINKHLNKIKENLM